MSLSFPRSAGRILIHSYSRQFACPVEWARRDQPVGYSTGVSIRLPRLPGETVPKELPKGGFTWVAQPCDGTGVAQPCDGNRGGSSLLFSKMFLLFRGQCS